MLAHSLSRVGPKQHVMSYSILAGEAFNIVANIEEPLDPSQWDEKDSSSVEKMRSYYKGWDPA